MFSSIKKINCTKKRKIWKKLMQLTYTHMGNKQSQSLIRYHPDMQTVTPIRKMAHF